MNTTNQKIRQNGQTDPTKTKTLRSSAEATINRYWRDVRGIVSETVQQNDALRLIDSRTHGLPFDGSAMPYRGRPADDFGAEDNAGRMAAWAAWFPTVLDEHVTRPRRPAEVVRGRHFTGNWVREAYARGMALGGADARQAGLVSADDLQRPSEVIRNDTHQEGLGTQYRAIYSDLTRVASETETDVERTLDSSLPEATAGGLTVSSLVSRLNSRVEKVGATGTVRVVDSRIVDTVNEGVIRRAKELGASEIGVTVEGGKTDEEVRWETADDEKVCSDCWSLAGQTWTMSEVEQGLAPRPVRSTHPRCRCRLTVIS